MLVKTNCAAVYGLRAELITVEVSVQPGIRYYIVGLPDSAVRESLQRIESAVSAYNYRMPRQKIIVNLAPAYLRKEGSAFDLSIALGILAASGQIEPAALRDVLILGELSLGGELLPVQGVLTMTLEAKETGLTSVILPTANVAEASLVNGIQVAGMDHLGEAIGWVNMNAVERQAFLANKSALASRMDNPEAVRPPLDFSDVKGQRSAKRALEVAAAGGHNILLCGPPGAGKSMLAQLMPDLLPPLTDEEQLETIQIFSAAGQLTPERVSSRARPFRAPHHTISSRAFAGGGTSPMPGEISLAHRGVLFLDEFPEFKRHVLEVLRQPMEARKITISRAAFRAEYPADFILVAAMNPCPCGHFNYYSQSCVCGPRAVRRYRNRISGPLLDRIDIQIDVHPVGYDELAGGASGESTEDIRQRVFAAHDIQEKRYAHVPHGKARNAYLNSKELRKHIKLDSATESFLRDAMNGLDLSARAYDKTLRLMRTIADLQAATHINEKHIAEAIGYRGLDREHWMD